MPTFPSVDLSNLDLSKLNLSKLDLSKLDLSRFDISSFDVPTFRFPAVDLPAVDLPKVDVDRLVELARDAAYVGVGLTVLAVQRAQVARRDAAKAIERQARRVRDLIPA